MNIDYEKIVKELEAELSRSNSGNLTDMLKKAIAMCTKFGEDGKDNVFDNPSDGPSDGYAIDRMSLAAKFYLGNYEVLISSPSFINLGNQGSAPYSVENKILFHCTYDAISKYYGKSIKWGFVATKPRESVQLTFSTNATIEEVALLKIITIFADISDICIDMYQQSWWDQLMKCINILDTCREFDIVKE